MYPYEHVYVENVFPAGFYSQLRLNWPDSSTLTSLSETGRVPKGKYKERFVLPLDAAGIGKLGIERRAFWSQFAAWFLSDHFLTAMIERFEQPVKNRLGDVFFNHYTFGVDSLVVRDRTNFSIGPHTDAPHRLLSMLFYCPDDSSMRHLGTSIYVPREQGYTCNGGPHYPHRLFQQVQTMEYVPNSLFAFAKSDHSFHGVEPISDEDVQRDILLYDIRVVALENAAQEPATRA